MLDETVTKIILPIRGGSKANNRYNQIQGFSPREHQFLKLYFLLISVRFSSGVDFFSVYALYNI